MNAPLRLDEFERLPLGWTVQAVDGLSAALDKVADAGPASRRFLRYQWFAAALTVYGGQARTIVVASEMGPAIALPLVRVGPGWAGLATVPGGDRWSRSFPAATADPAAWDALLGSLRKQTRALRIGPVDEGDPSLAPLLAAAKRNGWTVLRKPAQDGGGPGEAAHDAFRQAAALDPVIADRLSASVPHGAGGGCDWLLLKPGLSALAGRMLAWRWARRRT